MAVNKRLVLLITCAAAFITPFLSSATNIALPAIARDFGSDAILTGWVVTSFLLSAAIFVVPFGRLADIYGRRWIFIGGLAVVSLSALLAAVSGSTLMLIATRVIQGIGCAMVFGTSVAILTSAFPPKERGGALGINIGVTYTGLSLGPFFGGILTQYTTWRSIFLFSMLLSAAGALLAFWKLGEDRLEEENKGFDYAGCFLYGAMLFALMYGLTAIPAIEGVYWLAAGMFGLVLFIWWDLRHKNPVIKLSLFRRNVTFTLSNFAALINYSATFAVSFLLSYYLQYIRGFDPQTAGFILVAQPIVQALLSPYAGKLSDRIEPRIVASSGMALCIIGLTLFALLDPGTDLIFIVGGLMILGLGFALFSSPNTNAIMSSVDKRDYGVASGMVSTMRLIGQALSLGIAMLIFSVFIGRVQITPEQHTALMMSINGAFIVFALLCVIGLFASLARGDLRKEPMPTAVPAKK